MKTISIILLISLSFCEIMYKELTFTDKTLSSSENKLNGDFTACIQCLKDKECKNKFLKEILYDLPDDYDEDEAILQACLYLSGQKEFDNIVQSIVENKKSVLINRKSLKIKSLPPPDFELEKDFNGVPKEIDVNLKSIGSWLRGIKNRLVEKAKNLIENIRTAVNNFLNWCERQLDNLSGDLDAILPE